MRRFAVPPLGCCLPLLLLLPLLVGCPWGIIHDPPPPPPPAAAPNSPWVLVWHDEFSRPDGALPDPEKWTYGLGGSGWGNQELESYTERAGNAHIEHGNLVITARRENYTGTDGIAREYTSARLKTAGRFAQKYGRFEARIKIPEGQGMWPAFWMLGEDLPQIGWPKCGEIDIMENIGREPGVVHGSLHGPVAESAAGKGATDLTSSFRLPSEAAFAQDFHVYAMEWEPQAIRFYVDDARYATFTPESPGGGPWVFDHPFFLLLNVAVGGDWPGAPDATTRFPQSMLVDYVRVYTAR